jgi:hypothetical protein
MGDRLLEFPIERCKYRYCYNISTPREGCLQVFENIKGRDIALVLHHHIMCYNHA